MHVALLALLPALSCAVPLETTRLRLRRLTTGDADFILELLNDPDFVRHVGDRGLRTRADAVRFLETGPMASYAQHGYGHYLVTRKDGADAIGICGLRKRDGLDDPDLGFALLPALRGAGHAREAAGAVLAEAREVWHLDRVLAITSPDNHASIVLLGTLGFTFERMVHLDDTAPALRLFTWLAPPR